MSIRYLGIVFFALLLSAASAQTPGGAANNTPNSIIAKHALAISGNLFEENTPEYSAMLRASIDALNAKQKIGTTPQNVLDKIKTLQVTNLDTDPRYRNALSSIVHKAALGDPNKILNGRSDGPITPRGPTGAGLPPQGPGAPPKSSNPTRSLNAITHYPNVVFIQDSQNSFCSGVVIGRNKVLTALHCVCLHNMQKVGVGVSVTKDMKFTKIVSIDKMSECGGNGPDIAVIETAQDIYDSSSPTIFSTTNELDQAKTGIAVGYGNRDIGNGGAEMDGQRGYASVAIISARCSVQDSANYGCNNSFEFVAGPVSAENIPGDQCPGDSGGPLYIMNGKKVFLAGIADRPDNKSNLQCGYGGIYERIDGGVGTWINRILASN